IDTSQVTTMFNSIVFGLDQNEATQFNVYEMQVDIGDPIIVPDKPFNDFYVGDWAFLGGKKGSWTLTPGSLDGNVTIGGSGAAGGWSAIRGGFDDNVSPASDKALAVTGKLKLTGGGFEDWSSLRFGIFYTDSAGTIDSTNWEWNGTENGNYGYLFLPHSGNNDIPTWNDTPGTVGAIVGTSWISTNGAGTIVLSAGTQTPAGAVGGAGEYDFGIWVIKKSDGSQEVRYRLTNGSGYMFQGTVVEENPVATTFNSLNIALNSSTATSMDLIDVHVDQIALDDVPTGIKSDEKSGVPTQYALDQNYPNPFNPSTTIEFALPKSGDVNLVVYDILGRVVTKLVSGTLNAGYYKVNFDASNLASGIYFYSITAGDFQSVKKLMLLK
ncbi:MAG: T9SS type A sorting domain-containing protein, partial [Melioribacteraceae bacterium]|nr:T9SS type A sorting domain-containing protein [Melioribacteraceae bacterium]